MAERSEYEKWAATLPNCAAECDGDLEGGDHDETCPCYGKPEVNLALAFAAGERAFQERAVAYLESHAGAANAKKFAEEIRAMEIGNGNEG